MPKFNPILLSVTILLTASLACALPNVTLTVPPTADQTFFNTAIAQTVAAAVVQSQIPASPTPAVIVVTETPSLTFTPLPPSLTATASVTPSPVFTATPLVPQVMVTVDTNCRVGPGKVYDRVGALLVGQVAEVVGRNDQGNYWLIRNPNRPSEFCWLWGEYAILTGNYPSLPIYTPPPTPTPMPGFGLSYSGKDTCFGWWVDLDLENTGGVTFRSYSLTLRDTVTETVVSAYADGFTDHDGCLDTTTRDKLNPGDTRTISSPAFSYDPSGHKLRATVTLCSNTGQNGICVTEVTNFTP